MKSLMLLLMGIALIWVGCVRSSYVTQDNYLAHQGFIELSKGNYSMAEANLLVSLDIEPNNPYSLLNLGAVYQDTGRTKISDMKTLFIASKDHLPSLSDTTAINASALYVEGKQEPTALTLSDGPSAVGISAIGASAGAVGGESGGGSSGGGGPGDGGSGGGGSGDGGSDGGGSGDGGSDGGGTGNDGGNSGGNGGGNSGGHK